MWKTSTSARIAALSDAVEALADAVHAPPGPIGVRCASVSERRETATTGCDVVDGSSATRAGHTATVDAVCVVMQVVSSSIIALRPAILAHSAALNAC